MRVLQIEDDPDILEISRLAIELATGIELHQRASGLAGIEALPSVRPEVILLDVMMPDMDGTETLARIRASEFREVPVIFVTARARESDLNDLKSKNVAGVIIKPFDPLTLAEQITDIVEKSRRT